MAAAIKPRFALDGNLSLVCTKGAKRRAVFESLDFILCRTHSEFVILKQRRNHVEGIELVRLESEGRPANPCFSSRPFVLCSLRRSLRSANWSKNGGLAN